MAMSMRDFRVLEKLMSQTTSDNDHEALAALRSANAIMSKYNYTWPDAFGRLVKVLPDPSVPDVEEGGDTIPQDHSAAPTAWISDAFERLEVASKMSRFLYSLKEQWNGGKGFLSAKQQAALRKNLDEL